MRPINRSLLLAGLAGLGAQIACTSYRRIEPIDVANHGEIRITTTDDVPASLREPRVFGDTLVGSTDEGDILRIPLAEVREIEAKKPDHLKTAAVVLGTIVVVGVVAIGIWLSTDPCLAAFC